MKKILLAVPPSTFTVQMKSHEASASCGLPTRVRMRVRQNPCAIARAGAAAELEPV